MIVYLHPFTERKATEDLVAQLVEHLPFKEVVLGSSPSQVTECRKSRSKVGIFYFKKLSLTRSLSK